MNSIVNIVMFLNPENFDNFDLNLKFYRNVLNPYFKIKTSLKKKLCHKNCTVFLKDNLNIKRKTKWKLENVVKFK